MQFNKSKVWVLVAASSAVLLGVSVDEARAQTQCQANELAKLVASDGAPWDGFGFSPPISGGTVLIGGFADEVYVFSPVTFQLGKRAAGTRARGLQSETEGGEASGQIRLVVGVHPYWTRK